MDPKAIKDIENELALAEAAVGEHKEKRAEHERKLRESERKVRELQSKLLTAYKAVGNAKK